MTGNVEPEKNNGKKQRIAMIFRKFCREDVYQSAPVTPGGCFHGTYCCRREATVTPGRCCHGSYWCRRGATVTPVRCHNPATVAPE
jgi:hypothetical protein